MAQLATVLQKRTWGSGGQWITGKAAMRPYGKEGFPVAGHSQRVRAGDSSLPLQWDSCAHFAVLHSKKEVKKMQNVKWEATEVLEDLFCQEMREKALQGAGCRSSRGARFRLSWAQQQGRGQWPQVSMKESPIGCKETAFHRERG